MANLGESGYSGIRYLLEATGPREYTIKFVDGSPLQGVKVFGGDFKPNETIFAIDDDGYHTSKELFCTVAFQVQTNSSAKPITLQWTGVEYMVDAETGVYRLTNFSLQKMKEAGFDDKFPRILPLSETSVARLTAELEKAELRVKQLKSQMTEMTASRKTPPAKEKKRKHPAVKKKGTSPK